MKCASIAAEPRSTQKANRNLLDNGNGPRCVQPKNIWMGSRRSLSYWDPERSSMQLSKPTLLRALSALKKGDFSARLPPDLPRMDGKIADTFNEVVELNQRMAEELRAAEPRGGQGREDFAEGGDGECHRVVEGVGRLREHADQRFGLPGERNVARVIGAVAKGDLSQNMAMDIEGRPLAGEFLRTARTVNTMVEQLGSFAAEVTRVAREVGTEGKLGGQAKVKGVAGTWKDLTDSVNSMAGNLTSQVRNIAQVTTAVANGDLSKKITVDVKGEILELKNTINTMVDQLRSFASEVTRVAARSRHRRKAGRAGGCQRRGRNVEGFDRLGESNGRQSDRAGAQHRAQPWRD